MLSGKNIILGVTGGIAAYKSVFLLRQLIKQGNQVKVIMTPSAREFVGPLTFSTLSKNPVYTDFFHKESGEWHSHVELANWADMLLVAPLTANTAAKMVYGLADNLLLAVYLSAVCPVVLAPAMDLNMYHHPATQQNLKLLKERGNIIIPVAEGELASGICGEGRMAEPSEIVEYLNHWEVQGKFKTL